MNLRKFLLTIVLGVMSMMVMAQHESDGLTIYKLDNGLTVILWEDQDAPNVYGEVLVRAGSIDEPKEYTGLAHYLEHMLFKGTQTIGALDWEKEKPIYEEIIRLYDEFATETDPAKREALTKQINEKSREAAQYGATDDFSNLIEYIGGEGLNATTAYDRTNYFNYFPPFQMERWLNIYADRLVNPVFRAFQAELENVFEEYNMGQDNAASFQQNFISEHLYKGHPYERDIIGTAEHLKNPRLSKIIDFYNTWYVPNNMALILVGNFNTEEVKPMIEKTFSRFEAKPLPERVSWTETGFEGNPKFSEKVGYYPELVFGYKGVKVGDPDELYLEVVMSLLNNSQNTGLFDKLMLDGTITAAQAYSDTRRDMGRIMVYAIPYYDYNQEQFESNSQTSKIIFDELNKLKTGDIEDWRIEAVKNETALSFDQMFESQGAKEAIAHQMFLYDLDPSYFFDMKKKVLAMTKEDIMRVAKKYFDANYMTFEFEEGDPKKTKLDKPKILPLEPPTGKTTQYAEDFKKIPMGTVEEKFSDMSEVQQVKLDEHIRLYYTENKKNDIFSLVLRYGVGTDKMPKLEYATDLMEMAGVMPSTDAQSFRRQLAEAGGQCSYSVGANYLTVYVSGREDKLNDIMQLVQRQILMPKLDDKQLDQIKGNEFSGRLREQRQEGALRGAFLSYMLYKEKSPYLDRLSLKELIGLNIPQLTAEFAKATKYDLQAFYVGKKPIQEVIKVIPQTADMLPTESPIDLPKATYDKTQIYFLPNSQSQQAQVYFYVDGKPFDLNQTVNVEAFDQYFSGGFSGLVMHEIREKRSLAYTAYGYISTPNNPGNKTCLIGYVGCQPDKVVDAVSTYMDLLSDMPQHPERIENIKAYLRQVTLTGKPNFRSKAMVFAEWQRLGYTQDPAIEQLKQIDALTFEDIVNYYNAEIKGKPITIIIMGDPKKIDQKALQAKYGKIQKVSKSKLFSPLDFD